MKAAYFSYTVLCRVYEHPECAEITRLDMAELLDSDYWLEMDEDEVNEREDGPAYRQLAEKLSRTG